MRTAISLPTTLMTVPTSSISMATTVGIRKLIRSPLWAAVKTRKVTTQERTTNISQVCTQ